MVSRRLTKLKIVLKQNLYAFLIVIVWFSINYFYFLFMTQDFTETWKLVFFFKEGDSEYAFFYGRFTEFIIFGLVFSLITVELFRKYNPEITCRNLSKKLENHIIIIGYSNIAKRIHKFFEKKHVPHVIIDKDYETVEELILNEEPIVSDDILNKQTLIDASVNKAKAIYVMINNLEVQMFVNYEVRQLNKRALLVSRIFQDDIGDLINKTYDAKIISTSKYAAQIILKKIKENNFQYVLLIGINHISHRILHHLDRLHVNHVLIEEEEEQLEEAMIELDDEQLIIGDPKEPSVLRKANIKDVDCVINVRKDVTNTVLVTRLIRDLNPTCKIITRIFLDSVAEMLEKPPFNCEVISSSKETLKMMEEQGLLDV